MGITGCGGGGDDGGGGGGGGDAALVGTWQFFESREDGNVIPARDAMGWEGEETRTTVQFNADGTLVVRDYNENGDLVGTENGTWNTQGNTLTINLDEQMQFQYAIDGNILTLTQQGAEGQSTMRWAKVVNLTGHDAALVRTWVVERVQTDGNATSVVEYLGMPAGTQVVTMQMLANGNLVVRPLGIDNNILGEQQFTWATGGGELAVTLDDGFVMRGAYAANNTSAVLLDQQGRTVELELEPFAGPGLRPANLVGTWRATGATRDGEPISLVDLFGLEGADTVQAQLFADGTAITSDMNGNTPVESQMQEWSTDGNQLHIGGLIFTYNVVGDQLTLTMPDDEGHVIELTLVRL